MQCDNCGSPARHAPLDGEGPVLCEDCSTDRVSQSKFADHGGNGQQSLAGFGGSDE